MRNCRLFGLFFIFSTTATRNSRISGFRNDGFTKGFSSVSAQNGDSSAFFGLFLSSRQLPPEIRGFQVSEMMVSLKVFHRFLPKTATVPHFWLVFIFSTTATRNSRISGGSCREDKNKPKMRNCRRFGQI